MSTEIYKEVQKSIRNAISRKMNVFITGGTGTGKTYTVRSMFHDHEYTYVDCAAAAVSLQQSSKGITVFDNLSFAETKKRRNEICSIARKNSAGGTHISDKR